MYACIFLKFTTLCIVNSILKLKKGEYSAGETQKSCFDTHEGDSETHHRDAIRTGLPVINLKIASPSVVQICLTVDFEGF